MMKFIKLTTIPKRLEIFIKARDIESITLRYSVLDEPKPMGGTYITMNSGKIYLVKESPEWIIAEINREDSGSKDEDAGPYYKNRV